MRHMRVDLIAIWLFAVAVCAHAEAQLLLAIDLSRTPDHSGKVYMATIDKAGEVGQVKLVISDAERMYLAERGGHLVYRTNEGQWLRGTLAGPEPTLVPVALPESMDERESQTFGEIRGIALSNSGSQAAWVGPRSDGKEGLGIIVSDLETGNSRTLVTSEELGWCGLVTWSPDDTRLTFHAKNGQMGSTLMVYDLVADRVFAVAPRSMTISMSDGIPTSPKWSPDGRRIMFSARYEGDRLGEPLSYVAPAAPWSEGTPASGLTRVSSVSANWSSDSKSVVGLRETGRQGNTITSVLDRQSVEGEAAGMIEDLGHELVVDFAKLRGACASPGGRYVAYSILNEEGTATTVVVFDSESGVRTEVLTVPGLCGYEPRWIQMGKWENWGQ